MVLLKEDRQLYRGIFWIPDIDNVESSELYFTIPCDMNGYINDPEFQISDIVSSTGSDNYNHKKLWRSLGNKYTNGKDFSYYPRGRVEISNGIAKVFHSPHIPQEDLKRFVVDKFNLTSSNGIKKIKMIADGSDHYRCYLDGD